jgi:hypothetical protein
MAKTFVAINDPVHALLRQVTRQAPLSLCLSPSGAAAIEYKVNPASLPEAYYSLAVFHALDGLSLGAGRFARWRVKAAARACILERVNYFDARRLDRRCGRDLRLKLRRQGPGLLAGELLTFGTGMLRARNDIPSDPLHQELWRRHGRIHTRHEVVYATIRALPWNTLPLLQNSRKESFDSSNLLYGDVFGELEQLWERRADTAFLDQVAQDLQHLGRHGEVAGSLCPPLNVTAVVQLHLRAQALWKTPPANARILLRRLEYILDHTILDNAPDTIFAWPKLRPTPQTKTREGKRGASGIDRSGYDGWLQQGP